MDDTLYRQSGAYSGLKIQNEGGSYGTVELPLGPSGRLPHNSRFVNPAATTMKVAFGIEKDGWKAEVFIDNLRNDAAPVMQIAGHYTPVVTVQRPRSMGLRFSFEFE